MRCKHILALSMLLVGFAGQANMVDVAGDDANNYGNAWSGNGGFGFDDWSFRSDASDGFAGTFLANKSGQGDLNHIASNPSDNAWGTFANGGGFNQVEAYRGFSGNSLSQTGDQFKVSFEHGGIVNGGSVGITLRNGNVNNNVGDYNAQSRFEFSFIGGSQSYSIFDGTGQVDTGIGFTDAGLDLVFTLFNADNYQLSVFNAFDGSLTYTRSGSLMDSGSIDSVALFNRDAETANAYFNELSISKIETVEASAPALGMFVIAFGSFVFARATRVKLKTI